MKWSIVALALAVVLLALADFLAFHDVFEAHSLRDWLMLAATILAGASLAKWTWRIADQPQVSDPA